MDEKTQQILEIVFLCVASTFTLIASSTFILYIIIKTILHDCKLQEKLFPSKKHYYVREPFFNMHTRFQLALHISIILANLSDLYIVIYRPREGEDMHWMCQLQAIQMQFSNWLVFMYSTAIAFWIMIYIVFAHKWRFVERKIRRIFEVISHIICWGVALLFTSIPFIGHTYGKVKKIVSKYLNISVG